jgi:tetratricopeptide (TPR) repeat protein
MTSYDNKAFLLSVNGEKVSSLKEVIVDVPPGPVVIVPIYSDTSGNKSATAYPETYILEPGHTYILGGSLGEVQTKGTRYSPEFKNLFFYMTDQNTKMVIHPVSIGEATPPPGNQPIGPSGMNSGIGWFTKGIDFTNSYQYEKAIECFDKSALIDPDFSAVYSQRGQAYYSLGKYKEAIIDLTKALSLNPSGAWDYYYRGLSYKGVGDMEKARKDLKKGCEEFNNPDSCGAYEAIK